MQIEKISLHLGDGLLSTICLNVSMGKQKGNKSGIVDAELAAKVKKSLDLSKRDTKKMLKILRKGNVKVEKHVMDILDEIGGTLEDDYEDVKMEFEVNENTEGAKLKTNSIVKKEVDVTIFKDSKRFVEKVIEARGLNRETVKSRVVIDSGQSSLKIVLSVYDGDIDPEISFAAQEGPNEKMTGVNRLLILAEVDEGLERHHNIRKLLERLQLHQLPGLVLVGDLSITNVYLGISKHGGKYVCYICEGPSTLKSGKLRTFGSLHAHYTAYTLAGSVPKTMQNYKNVINKCLVEGKPEELVGEQIPLPELHLLIGVVNHFYKVLGKVWPSLTLWGRGKWTVHGRHGGGLDGVNCDK